MKIYICHTYGRRHGLTDEECEANALSSIEFGRQVILKGHNPFIPNLFHWVHKNWKESPDETVYLSLVSDWIQHCNALLVASMPKWDNSGVKREIKIAEALGKKIYWALDELPCVHDWRIDSSDYGRCLLCNKEKDFKPGIDRALGYGSKPVRKDFHYERNLVTTGGFYLQGKINKSMRTVDHCFSTDWIE